MSVIHENSWSHVFCVSWSIARIVVMNAWSRIGNGSHPSYCARLPNANNVPPLDAAADINASELALTSILQGEGASWSPLPSRPLDLLPHVYTSLPVHTCIQHWLIETWIMPYLCYPSNQMTCMYHEEYVNHKIYIYIYIKLLFPHWQLFLHAIRCMLWHFHQKMHFIVIKVKTALSQMYRLGPS